MKHVSNKVERWELRLSGFRYEVAHISGYDNVWADLSSCWGSSNHPKPIKESIQTIFQAPNAPDLDTEFCWPRTEDLSQPQKDSIYKKDESIPLQINIQGLYE